MVKLVEETAGCASRKFVVENQAIDNPPKRRNLHAYAQAEIPNSAIQGETFQLSAVPNTIRIHLDVEGLIKQARNWDEQLAIIAAINRFYMIALFGTIDRRSTC
jgi:hypothetical protein